VLRAQKYAKVATPECACPPESPESPEAPDTAEAEADGNAPVECTVSNGENGEAHPADCTLQENPPATDAADHEDNA
jgi:hypothetical protein